MKPATVLQLVGVVVVGACGSAEVREPEPPPPITDEGYQLNRSMALTLLTSGQPERALVHVRPLAEQEPTRAEPLTLMARALVAMGAFHQARGELTRAIELEPTYAPAHALLGVVLDSMGLHGEAETAHREAIRLEGRDAGYHNNLGFSLYLQERYTEARAELEAALELDPTLRKARNNLGFALAMEGSTEHALAAFRVVNSEAQANNNLGLACEARGEVESARTFYERALQVEPGSRRASENLARLSKPAAEVAPAPPKPGIVPDEGGSP